MKLKLTSIIVLILIIYGCSTDFDMIAPYKEIMVIDGLIDKLDSVQSIKISKAFLGEGDANVMAKQSDSINYPDILDVQIDRIRDRIVLSTKTLTRTELYDKDIGTFYSPYHVIYKYNDPIYDDSEYKIRVTNRQTGVTASSTTKIVKDITPGYPKNTTVVHALPFESKMIVRFNPGTNSSIFDFQFIFHYREIDLSGNSTFHSINWDFPEMTANNTAEIIYDFFNSDLFAFIGSNIPVVPGYFRRLDSLEAGIKPFEYKLMEGSEDLRTYMELHKPSTGIVQDRPLFTTVENGLGLFTSRIIHSIFCNIDNQTMNALDTSAYTSQLNFEF